jgi:hypothetical protein
LAGVYDGQLVFGAATVGMQSVNNSGTPTTVTAFVGAEQFNFAAFGIILELADGSQIAGQRGLIYDHNEYGTTDDHVYTTDASNSANNRYTTDTNTAQKIRCVAANRGAAQASQVILYEDGILGTQASSTLTGSLPASAFTAEKWNLGARNNGASFPAQFSYRSLVIYESLKASTEVANISTQLAIT